MCQNQPKHKNCSGHGEKNHGSYLAIYEEVMSGLTDMGWKAEIQTFRDFSYIFLKSVHITAFISDGILHIVRGYKLPPEVYRESISQPGFDIVEAINKYCSNLITDPRPIN